MTRFPSRLLVATLALGLLSQCGNCDCSFGPKPPKAYVAKAGTQGTVPAPVTGARLAADLDAKGQVALAVENAAGDVSYAVHENGKWAVEPVLGNGVGGPVALARNPTSGEAEIAAVVAANPDLGAVPIGAVPGAPAKAPKDAGELVVARRRLPMLWRLKAVASDALDPTVAVDAKGAVHLAFLQATTTGYLVVYARLDGDSVSRSTVGQTTIPRPPVVALVGGHPRVAYVGTGPQVILATAGAGDTFTGRPVPAGIFGEPVAAPSAFAYVARPHKPPFIAFIRPFGGGTFRLFGPVRAIPKAAKDNGGNLLMVSVFDGTGPESRVIATLPKGGPPPTVALALSKGGLLVAATAGGTPLTALRKPIGWDIRVPAGGKATAGALAGDRPVFLLGKRMHVGAAPKASKVGPH